MDTKPMYVYAIRNKKTKLYLLASSRRYAIRWGKSPKLFKGLNYAQFELAKYPPVKVQNADIVQFALVETGG